MGAILPPSVADSPLSQQLIKAGLSRFHQGKVRDTFKLPDYPELLLQLVTDRISIFDFVLPATVQDKGKILAAMTVFWLRGPLSEFNHHLVATGKEIDRYLPTSLQNNPELQTRALVVKKLRIVPVECIARGYLTGSGWSSYQNDGTVCGIKLPAGLCNDSQLPEPIFTPTTKAESGHDLSLDARRVTDEHGPHLKVLTLAIYSTANKYARSRGIIIADFKLEFGDNGILGDEVVTPDSSRFWHEDEWKIALKEGRIPTSQDKEFVRTWGKRVKTPFKKNGAKIVGINNLDPENPDHLKFVHSLTVPKEVLTETAVRYREIFQQLVRVTIRDFQLRNLGIIG